MMRFIFLLVGLCTLQMPSAIFALEIHSWETKTGSRVLFVESHDLPIIDMRLSFRAGSSRDGDQPGIGQLVNGLLVEGNGQLSVQDIAYNFERVGARLGHYSSRDMAWISLRSLSEEDKFGAVIDLFARISALPSFPPDALERDREAMIDQLAQRETRIAAVARSRFFQLLYEGHPYQYDGLGTAQSLAQISRDDLKAFHQRYYVAANATLAITGDLTLAQAKRYADLVTGYLPEGKPATRIHAVAQSKVRELKIPFESTQTYLILGLPALSWGDEDAYALQVGNHILGGGGFSSRLTNEIRDKRGLTYNVSSYFSRLEAPAPFQIGMQTRNHQAQEAMALMEQELETFIVQGPGEDELRQAQKNITGGFALSIDSNRKIVEQLAMIGFYQLPLDYLDNYNRHILNVSVDDIKRTFRKHVKLDQMVRIIVGADVVEQK